MVLTQLQSQFVQMVGRILRQMSATLAVIRQFLPVK